MCYLIIGCSISPNVDFQWVMRSVKESTIPQRKSSLQAHNKQGDELQSKYLGMLKSFVATSIIRLDVDTLHSIIYHLDLLWPPLSVFVFICRVYGSAVYLACIFCVYQGIAFTEHHECLVWVHMCTPSMQISASNREGT